MAIQPITKSTQVVEPPKVIWHVLEVDETLQQLGVDHASGLSESEVQARLKQYGANELIERRGRTVLGILWEQMTAPLVLLLLFAAAVSAVLGKVDNVIAIMAIVILNAALGVFQEYRAEQAIAALKKLAAPLVRVRRGGRVIDVQARDIVPGDVILLEAGTIIPADARLFESANLRVQEASLTGESQPVEKSAAALNEENAPLGDRFNMVYMGTAVTYGRGEAVVTSTGMATELGRIAELIQTVESEKTPLQRRMDEVGEVMIKAALVVMALGGIVGLITQQAWDEVLLNAVAIAVAVVPEGLPAVVTIALALGAQRMLRRNALIRKLPAVETLGSVTVICSDKTGTLTENRMTVTMVDVAGNRAHMEDAAADGIARIVSMNGTAKATHNAAQAIVLAGGTLTNDAVLERDPESTDNFIVVGDPTEGSIVLAAARFGLLKPHLDQALPRVGEVPFESERKRMTTVHQLDVTCAPDTGIGALVEMLGITPDNYIGFTKGAVDSLLDVSTGVWVEGEAKPLSAELRHRIEAANNDMAKNGLRVLGLAYRHMDALPTQWEPSQVERDLVFVGMVGIIDPPRKEVKDAVRVAKTAGIRPIMITGDHPLTAYAIARDLGIASEGDRVVTGRELSEMSQQQLDGIVEDVSVFARVSPEHKLNIVESLQKKGHLAAMTGDGVNDAPALKRSDIGVAMGITGTAVSKEASDVVIVDDNFATIVAAVEEGRTIYENVRRFIKYLLASNTGELFVLLTTQLIAGMTIPLTTLQILWMNLITDGIPALALGVERAEKGAMQRPPYPPNESVFGRGLGRHILLVGMTLGITGLALGYLTWSNNVLAANGEPAWNTMVFMFLTIAQMGHAIGLRSHRESVFEIGILGNRLLLGAVALTVTLQLIAIYTPFFNNIFNTNPLTLEQLGICLILSTVVFWVVELEKLAIRRGWLK